MLIVSMGLNSVISMFFTAARWITISAPVPAISTLSTFWVSPRSNLSLESLTVLPSWNNACSSISKILKLSTGNSKIFFANSEPILPAPPVIKTVLFFSSRLIFAFILVLANLNSIPMCRTVF